MVRLAANGRGEYHLGHPVLSMTGPRGKAQDRLAQSDLSFLVRASYMFADKPIAIRHRPVQHSSCPENLKVTRHCFQRVAPYSYSVRGGIARNLRQCGHATGHRFPQNAAAEPMAYDHRTLHGRIVLLAIVLAIAAAYDRWAFRHYRSIYKPPGQLFTVDGFKMHLFCTGSGTPTVILESGVGDDSLKWARVQPELSKMTRVCSYDREVRPERPSTRSSRFEFHSGSTARPVDGSADNRPNCSNGTFHRGIAFARLCFQAPPGGRRPCACGCRYT